MTTKKQKTIDFEELKNELDAITVKPEALQKEAQALGIDLNYEPETQMEDIRLLPSAFWHNSRATGWGGSNEGALNEISHFTTLEQAIREKITGLKAPVSDFSQFLFDYGHALEWVLLKRYATIRGYKYLAYNNYYVVVENASDDVSAKYSKMKLAMRGDNVYSYVTKEKEVAEKLLNDLINDYPQAYIAEEVDDTDTKDIRDITEEEHKLYDSQGIVCVDRRQYRHPKYTSMLGDLDGVAITPTGERIGLECKTYNYTSRHEWETGVFGINGRIKNEDYAYQVMHYMSVENLNRFDIIACCSNHIPDMDIITVNRNLQMEQMICENCEEKWQDVLNKNIPISKSLTSDEHKELKFVSRQNQTDQTITLPKQLASKIDELLEIKDGVRSLTKQKDELQKKKEALENEIEQNFNDYQFAIVPTDNDYDYQLEVKQTHRTSFDDDTFEVDYPNTCLKYKKTTYGTTLDVKRFKKNS